MNAMQAEVMGALAGDTSGQAEAGSIAEPPSAASLEEADICDLAQLHGVPREEVFGWNFLTGTIVTRDGRKLTISA